MTTQQLEVIRFTGVRPEKLCGKKMRQRRHRSRPASRVLELENKDMTLIDSVQEVVCYAMDGKVLCE